MKLISLHLNSFRKHSLTRFEPYAFEEDTASPVLIIYGKNGSGKTNILEAIHYSCLSRNFLSVSDAECISFGENEFEIKAEFVSNRGTSSSVRVYYSQDTGKHIFIGKSEIEHFSELLGHYPCVALSPEDIGLIKGAPQERRKFLDSTISQINKLYLSNLQSFKRALQQRNRLLADLKLHPSSSSITDEVKDVWTQRLIDSAAPIIVERLRFIREFSDYLQASFHHFKSADEVPKLIYESSDLPVSLPDDLPQIRDAYQERAACLSRDEIRRGMTLFGPHRDDVDFFANHYSLKKFASQGQQKTFLICLKLAQRQFIESRLDEKPIFLLDDVLSELDDHRANDLIDLLSSLGQSLVTTTGKRGFSKAKEIPIEKVIFPR